MQLRIWPRADIDVDEIILHFAEMRAIRAGHRFLDALDHSFQLLAQTPEIACTWDSPNPALDGIRFWRMKGFRNYLIFFRVRQNKVVEVLRILHGARNLESLLIDTMQRADVQ